MERKTISIREAEAEKLKEKSFKLSMQKKEVINESDIIHYLINKHLREIEPEDIKKIKKRG